ncbi:MAG TPA: DUF4399 domain-containing protein [Gammaproteobacteria bacterium]|nr:DUF4399 domain-containing protein [Gammaproteobacteria bacterium]
MKAAYVIPALILLAALNPAAADSPAPPARLKAPAGAAAAIVSPTDGASVANPVTVIFTLKGMGVAPAGVERTDAGHFHLLVDAGLPPLDAPIPKDEQHLHFGGGQIQATLTLSPGKHTLQLLMGDARHLSFDPPVVSPQITIIVK